MLRQTVLLIFVLVCIQTTGHTQSLHTEIHHNSTSSPYGYYEYLPDGYFKAPRYYPLIIYLHGNEDKGKDLKKVLLNGLPELISKGKNYPFVILSPQNWGGFFNPELLRNFISYASENYRIDKSRVYLTGISAGAFSIWNYLSLYQDQVAAAVPIAGNGYSAIASACKIKNIPIWAFHGELDNQVKPGGTVGIVDAINKCAPIGKVSAKYTIYPGVGHDSWTRTYDLSTGNDIYSWMLKYSKKQASRKTALAMPIAKFSNTINKDIQEVGKLPVSLKNNTGISVSDPNRIWAVNKNLNENYLYLIDTLGKIIQIKRVGNSTNLDWSDLAKDKEGNLYIGDIGNAGNIRKNLQIYKVTAPSNIEDEPLPAKKIEFSFADQKLFPPDDSRLNFDCESMLFFNDSLFVFSKNRTDPFNGVIKMYGIPATPGNYLAEPRDSIFLGNDIPAQYQVTAAAISPNQKNVVLLTHNKIWLFTDFKHSHFLKGRIILINLSLFSEKLAVDFKNNEELYITDLSFREIRDGSLYKINLSEWLK